MSIIGSPIPLARLDTSSIRLSVLLFVLSGDLFATAAAKVATSDTLAVASSVSSAKAQLTLCAPLYFHTSEVGKKAIVRFTSIFPPLPQSVSKHSMAGFPLNENSTRRSAIFISSAQASNAALRSDTDCKSGFSGINIVAFLAAVSEAVITARFLYTYCSPSKVVEKYFVSALRSKNSVPVRS